MLQQLFTEHKQIIEECADTFVLDLLILKENKKNKKIILKYF